MTNECRRVFQRNFRNLRTLILMFDLHAVAGGVENDVMLNHPTDEGASAVRVAKINSSAGFDDRIVTNCPIPTRALRGNADGLLVVAMADDQVVLDPNMMRV